MFCSALGTSVLGFFLILSSHGVETYACNIEENSQDICMIPDQWQMLTKQLAVVDEVSFPPNYPLIHSEARGAKKLKYKHDFASVDAGARVLASASGIKGSKAIQRHSHETYMMSECEAPTWVVIAFPERLSVEMVAFESAESFSSYYRKVAILGSNSYPAKNWRLLAVVELDPDRVMNVFNLQPTCDKFQEGTCWVSHIKFQVLSFQPIDSIDVCTLSRFSVYGSTMLEGLESKMNEPKKKPKPTIPRNSTVPTQKTTTTTANTYEYIPISIPLKHSQDEVWPRLLDEYTKSFTPLETHVESYITRKKPRPSINEMLKMLYDESATYESPPRFVTTTPPSQVPAEIVVRDDDVILASDHIYFPVSSNYQGGITAVLEKIISDGVALEERTRLSSVRPSADVPPIISLADKLNDLQKALSEHVNRTMATTLIVKNIAIWLSMMNGEVDIMKEDVQENLKSQLEYLVRYTSSMKVPEFMRRLTKRACADSFSSYSLFESVDRTNERRIVCVLSGIYNTMGFDRSDHAERNPLMEMDSMLTFTQSGTLIKHWRFSYVLNLYLDSLRHSFSSPEHDDGDALYKSNPAYRCARLYLHSLASLSWPVTFLHLFPLPTWSTCDFLFQHPLTLYWAILAFEVLQVFGTMLYTICSSLIYIFAIANLYAYFQSRQPPEDWEQSEVRSEPLSPTEVAEEDVAFGHQRSAASSSTATHARPPPPFVRLGEHYERLSAFAKRAPFRRTKSK